MDRFLSWPQLEPLIPYTRQHVGRLEAKGLFPRRRWLSANRVAWLESEIREWLESRQRGGPPQKADLGYKPRAAPDPDHEDLRILHELAAKLGLELVPRKSERRRSGSGP